MRIANNPVSGSGSAAKFPTYADIRETFQKALEGRAGVGPNHIPFYHKWLRDYLAEAPRPSPISKKDHPGARGPLDFARDRRAARCGCRLTAPGSARPG